MIKTKIIFLIVFLFGSSGFGDWKNSSATGNAIKPCAHDDAHRAEIAAAKRQVASMFQAPKREGDEAGSVDSNDSERRGDR